MPSTSKKYAGTPARTRPMSYGGFLATLTAWCEEQSIPYQGVPVGTIKRFIAGKGNADKQAVIAAVRARGFTRRRQRSRRHRHPALGHRDRGGMP